MYSVRAKKKAASRTRYVNERPRVLHSNTLLYEILISPPADIRNQFLGAMLPCYTLLCHVATGRMAKAELRYNQNIHRHSQDKRKGASSNPVSSYLDIHQTIIRQNR